MTDSDGEILAATQTGQLAASDLPPLTRIADRYRIERLLGMGAMGLVYLAWDEQLDVRVALKVLRPELAQRPDAFARFRQELLLARQVSSPHVVRIHDLVQHGATWMISMDFIAGRSLEQHIDGGTPIALDEALRITRQIALGLAAAQARSVVHRDLKPANLLLDENGNAYISDFGIARAAGATRLTGTGLVVGTPDYLSPEQARAEDIDGRSDQYALGLILREMLTGKLPFSGGTAAEMLAQRVLNEVPSLAVERPDLPVWVITLSDRLLRRAAVQRFDDTAEIAGIIDTARIAPPPSERGGSRRSLRLAWSLSGLAIAALLAWSIWRPTTPDVPVATLRPQLDIAVLPFVASDPAQVATAHAIGEAIAGALLTTAQPTSADSLRVNRALAALGLDAANLADHSDLIARQLGVKQLLNGVVTVVDGQTELQVRLLNAADGEVQWRMSTRLAEPQRGALPAAFAHKVLERLGAKAATTALPVLSTAGADAESAAQTSAVSRWTILAEFEANARSLDARSAARKMLDAMSAASSLESPRVRGYAALLVGDPAAAESALAPIATAVPHDHPTRILLARARAEQGKFDQAVADLRALVAEDERNVEAWFLLGKFAIMQGDAKTAVDEYLVRALVLAKRFGDQRWRAETANAFGVGYRNLGQMQEAAEEYERAISARNALGDARGEAVSRRNLAVALAYLGRHEDADHQLLQARALLEPLGDAAAMADLVNDAGVLAEERGDFREALDAFREALGFRQTQGDQRLIGESLINVGFTYYQVGEFDNALVYWQRADQVYAAIDDASGAVRAQQSLALAEIAKGDVVSARRSLDASLHRAEELQMAEERAVALVNRADLDRIEGAFSAAFDAATRARDLFVALDDGRGSTEADLLKIQILIEVGDAEAATLALQGLVAASIGSREQRAMRAQRVAELAILNGDAQAAEAAAREAIALADSARSLAQALSSRILLAEAESLSGQRAAAMRTLADARERLARYTSVPLRLRLLEAGLHIDRANAVALYREVRGELARWPNYGRALQLHALAVLALPASEAPLAAEATVAAGVASQRLRGATPEASRPATERWLDRRGFSETLQVPQ